jgi:hypothetical protein
VCLPSASGDERAVLAPRLVDTMMAAAQRLVLRTEQTPLRALWSGLYAAVIRVVAFALSRADPGVAVYVKGGLGFDEPLYGVSDIDMIAVAAADEVSRKERLDRAWKRLCRLPLFPSLVYLFTYDADELRSAASSSCLTYSLTSDREGAAFLGRAPPADHMNLLDRPGPFGPMHGWRLVRGPDRRPAESSQDPQERRIAAWLELQMWARHLFAACANPTSPHVPYLCFKLVVEPLRVWLWIAHGQQIVRRSEVLEQGLHLVPEEEEALRAAQSLRAALRYSPEPPLAEVAPVFFRLCSRIADRLGVEAEEAGSSSVEILWDGAAELAVPPGVADSLRSLAGSDGALELLPLADWRALVVPGLPDETCCPLVLDAHPLPAFLGAAALAGQVGAYPLVQVGPLLLLPAATALKTSGATNRHVRWEAWGRGKLRAIQCAVTDPVTFALLGGKRHARFTNLRGWCARDVARRAVAEHRAWLELASDRTPPQVRGWIEPQQPSTAPTVASLARLFTAARAACFLESVDSGTPRLALTLAAVAEQLADSRRGSRSVAEEALATYRACRLDGTSPDDRVVRALRDVVGGLDVYAS